MIRFGTPDDFDALIALGRMHKDEGWYSYLPYDEEKVRDILEQLHAGGGCILLHFTDAKLDGYMLGFVSEIWFCRERAATELGFYVHPERRGGMAAIRLLHAFVEWAEAQGVSEISITTSIGVKSESSARLLGRCGFAALGGHFKRKVLPCATA